MNSHAVAQGLIIAWLVDCDAGDGGSGVLWPDRQERSQVRRSHTKGWRPGNIQVKWRQTILWFYGWRLSWRNMWGWSWRVLKDVLNEIEYVLENNCGWSRSWKWPKTAKIRSVKYLGVRFGNHGLILPEDHLGHFPRPSPLVRMWNGSHSMTFSNLSFTYTICTYKPMKCLIFNCCSNSNFVKCVYGGYGGGRGGWRKRSKYRPFSQS